MAKRRRARLTSPATPQVDAADGFGELRSALQRAPSPHAWRALCAALDAPWARQPGARERWAPYVSHALRAWPDALRLAPQRWLDALRAREPRPQGWSLVRTIKLADPAHQVQDPLGWLTRDDAMAEVTHLDLLNLWVPSDSALTLGRAPALGALRALSLPYFGGREITAPIFDALDAPALRALHLGRNHLTERSAPPLGRWPGLSRLTQLNLEQVFSRGASASALLKGCTLPSLRALDLSDNTLELEGVHALLSAQAPLLESLALRHVALSGAPWRALSASTLLTQLTSLDLSATRIVAEALRRVSARSARWEELALNNLVISALLIDALRDNVPTLTRLSLASAGLDAQELTRALASAPWPALRALDLSRVTLDASSVEALCATSHLSTLTTLEVSGCELDASSLQRIARAMPALHTLHANDNLIGPEGGLALADATLSLHALELHGASLGDDGATTLLQSATTRALRRLVLSHDDLGDEVALAIARSHQLSGLRELVLSQNHISDAGFDALARSESAQQLDTLDLRLNRASVAARARLRAALPFTEVLC